MILFLDTSALVKLYVVEADSPAIHAAVARAETVAVSRIAWAEACAALARRARSARRRSRDYRGATGPSPRLAALLRR